MRVLFQDELTTKMLFGRIEKEIKEEELEKTINYIDHLNNARRKIITKCDIALQNNRKNGY